MNYLFEGYALVPERRELRHGDKLIAVEPQVFDLLEYLIRNRDRVVSRDDVFDAIWHGRAISESTLTSRVNAARSAIGDSGGDQRLIRTYRSKGFRFVGVVKESEETIGPLLEPVAKELPSAPLALPDRPSIGVLPFVNMSGDPEQEYFADGITEDIITALSRVRQFFVIARNSTFQFKGSSPDVRQVASGLGVRYVVEGSVRKFGKRIRISAQLVDGSTGNHIWAERFDRDLDDVFAIQDEITQSIVGQIEPQLSRAEYERSKAAAPENLDAWELFHHAMALIARRTKEGNFRARCLLERSLQLDPDFGPAHAAFAWSQAEDLFFRFAEHDHKDCLDHARKAVALDDRDPLGHFALAWALTFNQQPEQAIEQVKRAIEINPSYAHAHAILGRLLVHSGQCQEGIEHAELAIRLSPTDLNARQFINVMAIGNFYLGNDSKAIGLARQVIQTFDTWVPRMIITAAFGHLGDMEGARQARAEVEKHRPNFSIEQVRRDYLVFDKACLDRVFSGLRKAGVPEA